MFQKLMSALAGRTTAFCAAFFVGGHVMYVLHRLDATYLTFIVSLMGVVVAHSVKETTSARTKSPPPKNLCNAAPGRSDPTR